MSHPTKILKYDLHPDLHWVFEDAIKEVVEDLKDAKDSSSKLTSERLQVLERLAKHTTFLLGDEEATETFTYKEEFGSKDVVKHEYHGSKSYIDEYEYGLITLGSGNEEKAIIKSTRTYKNSDGLDTIIEKEYSYDEDGDIIGITTTVTQVGENQDGHSIP